ncbi:hypothetical protein EVAR_103176_1 [Eumeta japonica]|uniref:Uncharacterized protein n=1 Tax=Eumeta variegata TaxID=151549 RepID=A0A4C1YFF5_EUMVA|nr:hypothetical protein EVAR_103176_1 [Eumeta japonica]
MKLLTYSFDFGAARLDPWELHTVVPYTYTLSERSAELHVASDALALTGCKRLASYFVPFWLTTNPKDEREMKQCPHPGSTTAFGYTSSFVGRGAWASDVTEFRSLNNAVVIICLWRSRLFLVTQNCLFLICACLVFPGSLCAFLRFIVERQIRGSVVSCMLMRVAGKQLLHLLYFDPDWALDSDADPRTNFNPGLVVNFRPGPGSAFCSPSRFQS